MKRKFVIGVASIGVVLAGLGITVSYLWSADSVSPIERLSPEKREAVQALKQFSDGFAVVAEAVLPSVVTITSEKVVQPADQPSRFFSNDPFFRRFFGPGPEARPYTRRGLGSGVVVDSGGYILTNNHVIQGADELSVLLYDGRRLEAKVVGADPRTDLAVLEVDTGDLPALSFGSSEDLRIGEWVLAVGSPFSENLQATVTAGIVSAVGRSGMNLSEYEDFIQTDAAINPGNSGGALVNLDGELVGINSAIASRTGGSNGVGFAIPVDLAMDVMSDLIHEGKVTRGYLGVGIQDINAGLAEAMELETANGVLLTSIAPGGPSAQAGLEQGDVIVEYNRRPVSNTHELRLAVARTDPGSPVEVVAIRDGDRKSFRVILDAYPEEGGVSGSSLREGSVQLDMGMSVEAITPELSRRFQLKSAQGVVVTTINSGSSAAEAGIQPGDVILKVNRRRVDSPRDYQREVEATPDGRPVLLLMERRGNTFFLALHP